MRIAWTTLVALVAAASAAGQTPSSPALAQIRSSEAQDIQQDVASRPSFAKDIDYIALVAREEGLLLRALQTYAEERSDKQVGATASASGTTTLVSKGTVPQVLAFALENGAVTRSVSGTTVTFRSNIGGAVRALTGKGFFQLAPEQDSALILNRVALSASFDTSRGADGNTFTGDKQQLSQWTARFQAINRRDPQGSTAVARWRTRLAPLQTAISGATLRLAQALERDRAVQDWLAATASAVTSARTVPADKPVTQQVADIETALRAHEAEFPSLSQLQPETSSALDEYERSASAFIEERHNVLAALRFGDERAVPAACDRAFHIHPAAMDGTADAAA